MTNESKHKELLVNGSWKDNSSNSIIVNSSPLSVILNLDYWPCGQGVESIKITCDGIDYNFNKKKIKELLELYAGEEVGED